ncbi:MAG TPA: hypothetical protein PKE69_27855 [Pyrinomonadaceae bacterium]|nr:hypothetical protein [Pyrinomonadaceae bacterium]
MEALKIGDEKWVIACRKTEKGYEFLPLKVLVKSFLEREVSESAERWTEIDAELSYELNTGGETDTVTAIDIKFRSVFFNSESGCAAAIENGINYLHTSWMRAQHLTQYPIFVMIKS